MWSESLTSTTFSTTFDRKLRLEMGWYEATSLGSKFGFFRRDQIIAFLQQCRNVTWSNDALHMAAMTGLISLDCLISHVGAGSNRHCFASDFKRITISSLVTGWNSNSSSLTTWQPILGGNDADVDVRLRSIFVSKYCEKSSAVRRLKVWPRGCISSAALTTVPYGVATTGVNGRRPIVSKFALEQHALVGELRPPG